MAVEGVDGHCHGKREKIEKPASINNVQPWLWRMGGLTRDGIPEPFSRDRVLRRERFPYSSDHKIGNHTGLMYSMLQVLIKR